MPKYLTRTEFESMKVLRNRKCTIKQISEKMHISAPAVSRNLKYHSYEDYCLSMYSRRCKGGKEIETKSGPVKVTTPTETKKCWDCGKEKPLTEFVKNKQCKGGYAGQCKECRQKYVTKWKERNARNAREDMANESKPAVKLCKKCHVLKPLTEFDTNKNNKDGFAWQCKECRRAYQRKYDKNRAAKRKKKPVVEMATTAPRAEGITYYNPNNDTWTSEPIMVDGALNAKYDVEEEHKLKVGQHVNVAYGRKVKAGCIIGKCGDGCSSRWLVQLDGLFKRKVVASEDDIYLGEECSS